jgi:hypothetical protein
MFSAAVYSPPTLQQLSELSCCSQTHSCLQYKQANRAALIMMNSSSSLWCICVLIMVHCTNGFVQAGQRHIAFSSSSSSFAASIRLAAYSAKAASYSRKRHALTCSIWQDLTVQLVESSAVQAMDMYNAMLNAHPWQVDEITACSIYSISDIVGECNCCGTLNIQYSSYKLVVL